jgi:hypothetical protein
VAFFAWEILLQAIDQSTIKATVTSLFISLFPLPRLKMPQGFIKKSWKVKALLQPFLPCQVV